MSLRDMRTDFWNALIEHDSAHGHLLTGSQTNIQNHYLRTNNTLTPDVYFDYNIFLKKSGSFSEDFSISTSVVVESFDSAKDNEIYKMLLSHQADIQYVYGTTQNVLWDWYEPPGTKFRRCKQILLDWDLQKFNDRNNWGDIIHAVEISMDCLITSVERYRGELR